VQLPIDPADSGPQHWLYVPADSGGTRLYIPSDPGNDGVIPSECGHYISGRHNTAWGLYSRPSMSVAVDPNDSGTDHDDAAHSKDTTHSTNCKGSRCPKEQCPGAQHQDTGDPQQNAASFVETIFVDQQITKTVAQRAYQIGSDSQPIARNEKRKESLRGLLPAIIAAHHGHGHSGTVSGADRFR